MGSEHGQAAVEWTALVLLVALAVGALPLAGLRVDGRSLGGFLGHRIVCAVRRGCQEGDAALARAYGKRDAELVRAHAPDIVYEHGEQSLPIDYRRCRSRDCSDAPDDHDLDAHRTSRGQRATAFVRVVRRGRRRYVQYWFYYPEEAPARIPVVERNLAPQLGSRAKAPSGWFRPDPVESGGDWRAAWRAWRDCALRHLLRSRRTRTQPGSRGASGNFPPVRTTLARERLPSSRALTMACSKSSSGASAIV